MTGKRPADTGTVGQRQFKQTKLNFFSSASKSQPKTPPRIASDSEEAKEIPISSTTTTGDVADLEELQLSEQQTKPGNTTTSNQDNKLDTNTNSTSPQTTLTKPPPPPTPTSNPPPETTTTTPTRIRITDRIGDLFAAPPNTVLIHACNAVGSWGGGIALAFRNLYPAAFRVYRAHCARSDPAQLVGTALLIPPQGGNAGKGHYIGCLFTSRSHGRARDPPERIVRATGPAMRDLMRLIVEEEGRTGRAVAGVRMCRINSGLFNVPWGKSKRVIEELELEEGEVPGCAEWGVVEAVAYEKG